MAVAGRGDQHRLAVARATGRVLELTRPDDARAPLPYADAAFDTVVCCWVLCRVENVAASLAELHRVLAPGGQLLFLEHIRGRSHAVAAVQRALSPVWARVAGGCRLDRDTIGALRANGFVVDRVRAARPAGSAHGGDGRAWPGHPEERGMSEHHPGTLALVGGREWGSGCTFDADLLAASGADRGLVLPTAAAYEHPERAVERATAWFGALGATRPGPARAGARRRRGRRPTPRSCGGRGSCTWPMVRRCTCDRC